MPFLSEPLNHSIHCLWLRIVPKVPPGSLNAKVVCHPSLVYLQFHYLAIYTQWNFSKIMYCGHATENVLGPYTVS